MFKAMVLLRRRKGTTSEDFRAWWLERHAPMARQLPKLRRLCFNLVEAENDTPFDGVAELWFDSKADFEAAYASDIGKKVAADSVANVDHRERLLVTEHDLFPS